jgi:Component of IIS longevity pathway SMK-1
LIHFARHVATVVVLAEQLLTETASYTCTAVCALYLRILLLLLQDDDIVARIHRVHNVRYLRDVMLRPSCNDDLSNTLKKTFIDYDSARIVAALGGSGYMHRVMRHLYRRTATVVRFT